MVLVARDGFDSDGNDGGDVRCLGALGWLSCKVGVV